MKLEDFEKLANACQADMGEFHVSLDFYDACREMVPRMIKALNATKRERIYRNISCPACNYSGEDDSGIPCYCWDLQNAAESADKAFAELEQP